LKSGDKDYELYTQHIVEIDSDGSLRCGRNLSELFDNVARQSHKRIIIYVHGGRRTLHQSRQSALGLTKAIQESDSNAYPIFLNWEAGQATSYFRHVAYERNGVSYRESSSAAVAAIAAPLVFVSDLGRGACRFPINTLLSVGKVLQNSDMLVGRHDHFFPIKGQFDQWVKYYSGQNKIFEAYRKGFTYPAGSSHSIPATVSMGPDSHPNKVGFAAKYVATLPLQFISEPVLDTFGTPAWNNMVRRTHSMFHLQANYISEFHEDIAKNDYPKGGAALFFDALDEFMQRKKGDNYKLEIYAHSMGAMIANEAFAEHPDLNVKRLVYMAAACSIRDFRNTAGVYLEKHPSTSFYNLSLHPRAELDEVEVSGIPVRGSLLVWIDEFFNQPRSFGERTLGTFENAILAQDLLPRSPNVHLKAFPIASGPQKHKDFAKYCFWKDDFIDTSQQDRYYRQIEEGKLPPPILP
jgi:hypothetical protein